jgi:cytochrome c biogenesis protein CcmG, thiol:disulfide interchange protein DsbE
LGEGLVPTTPDFVTEGYRTRLRRRAPAVCDAVVVSRRVLLVVAGLAVLAVVVVIGLRQAPETKAPAAPNSSPLSRAQIEAKLGGAPPALAALHRQANELLPGGRDALDARLRGLRGHPVVVNVWAAWCGPCREELPVLQRASLEHGRRVAFLGVDLRDSRESAGRLLRRYPLTYPSVEDPDGRIFTRYGLQGAPSTIFYDARGRRTFIHQGPYLQRADLDADIRRYASGART